MSIPWLLNTGNTQCCLHMQLHMTSYIRGHCSVWILISINNRFSSINLILLIHLAHLICWLHHKLITSPQLIKLVTLEPFCYSTARVGNIKPWWLHSMWENFLPNSPNCYLKVLKHWLHLDYCGSRVIF